MRRYDGNILHRQQLATDQGDRTRRFSSRLLNPRHHHRRRHCSRTVQWRFENRSLVKACWWVKGTLMVQVLVLTWLHV
ncbi:hypothetical protein P8452_06698 [Trifolium repens]|nr:transmembrane protein [Trifolium repens]WJX16702.1 hypothetical protein P8452_06698 [Trifolium repens]